MIKPLKDRIIIKMKDYEDKTRSGIILSSSTKENPQVAEVIEVGKNSSVKKGDIVIVNKYAGTEIQYKGEDYNVLRIGDVLAIVEYN